MIPSVDLYKYFYAVADSGNISKAAEKMFTSQPVVSKYISRLEQELGVQLFIRTSRGVRLTEEGQILYEHVKTAFNYLEAGTDALKRQQAMGIGQLRIGVSTTLCKYLLLPYLKTYIEKHPQTQISIQCQSTHQTIEQLEQNQIDIGLIGKPEDTKSLLFYDMMEIEDIFVASDSYLANYPGGHMHAPHSLLSDATVMLLDKGNITRQFIDSYLGEQNITLNNLLEISTMDLLIDFAKIGIGIGCVIQEFVKDELAQGSLIKIPLKKPLPKRTVGFAIRDQNYMPIALKFFMEMMQFQI